MSFQVFTRTSHRNGVPTPSSRPRRVQVVETISEAQAFCMQRNAQRSAKNKRDGFHYEFAALDWYNEAFR